MAPVWCPKNFFWSIWKGGRYQLWTPNCSNPEVAHNKSMNMEITSLCNTVCPTFWLLKIPPLRYILIHFFDYFFNCKLFLLINSSYYKANTWLKNCFYISWLTAKRQHTIQVWFRTFSKTLILFSLRPGLFKPYF